MEESPVLKEGGLVLFKKGPAKVLSQGEKIELGLAGGERKYVRVKDVIPLHPGPVVDITSLSIEGGEVQEAWELLQGETPTLKQLAELVYGSYTPQSVWSARELLNKTPFFKGTLGDIHVASPLEVARERRRRKEEEEKEQKWEAFLKRFRANSLQEEDHALYADLELMALGKIKKSRILKALGKQQTKENAHKQLLEKKIWDIFKNPHPRRAQVPEKAPTFSPSPLPDEERRDFTHIPAFAIDDEGNRDPDDAISLDGEWIWVHVADVAALVAPGDESDQEAQKRASTLYFPEGVVPMLPKEFIEKLGLGLSPLSPAFSFGMRLNEEGDLVDFHLTPSCVKVTRLTYREADTSWDEHAFGPLWAKLSCFRQRRMRQQAESIQFPEFKISLSEGKCVVIERLPEIRSRELVAEAMILAGEAVACHARNNKIPLPYVTQGPPAGRGVPLAPGDLAAMFARRKQMKRSSLSCYPSPHAGLGLACYTRVTSPLRRYSDLLVMQQLRAWQRQHRTPMNEEIIGEKIALLSISLGKVNEADKGTQRHWRLIFFQQNPRWQGEGILVAQYGNKGIFYLSAVGLEVKVPLQGKIPLNTKALLALTKVDLAQGDLSMKLLTPSSPESTGEGSCH